MDRRHALQGAGRLLGILGIMMAATDVEGKEPGRDDALVTIFLSGDVMTGRGIDQVLPHPSAPRLYEGFVKDAREYVDLAQRRHGVIRKPVPFPYLWGDALKVLDRIKPDLRIINLETAVTTSKAYWKGKGINYRMHPRNIPCLTAAKIDCCVLSNNHVLDWGHAGLSETLDTLGESKIAQAGAGRNKTEAEAPAILPLSGGGRVLVFGWGDSSSGIPRDWAAGTERGGVNLLPDLSTRTARDLAAKIQAKRGEKDLVIASIHWGANWGYEIPRRHRAFAHALIDGGVDVVHGHSSHHPKAIEVYRGKPILYGCGDLINDYEGIRGYESYRGDLAFLYFLTMNPVTGELVRLELVPTQTRRFQIRLASKENATWLQKTMHRECARFGGRIEANAESRLVLRWR